MNGNNTVIRALHDVGLAGWFGGSLMGAVGLNGAASKNPDPRERIAESSAGWAMWAPVAAASIGAHLIGGAGLLLANRDRVKSEKGVGTSTAIKTAVTVAALATTAYSGYLGMSLASKGSGEAADGATEPSSQTPDDVAAIQRQLAVLAWANPVLTGTLVVLTSDQGERQRPLSQVRGVLNSVREHLPNAA